MIDLNDRDLPVIQQPEKRNKFGSRGIPQYVKNGFPEIIPANNNKMDLHSFLPHIPGAEENFGMLYSKPETDSERHMQELWLARRRQEVCLLQQQLFLNVIS